MNELKRGSKELLGQIRTLIGSFVIMVGILMWSKRDRDSFMDRMDAAYDVSHPPLTLNKDWIK